MSDEMLFFGDWQVNPASNSLQNGDAIKQLEPKAMDVLVLLCQQGGEVLSSDDIVRLCWGNVPMGDNPVHKVINQLRSALGDKASAPTYIETIRKRGYRTLAKVSFPLGHQAHAELATWQGESPFPGLRPYQAKDAQVFFGRSTQIATLLSRISQQVKFGRAFCLLLGPSGSGKSSLVNAGILPNLMTSNGYDGIGVYSNTALDLADVTQDRLMTDLACAMLDWDIDDKPVFDGFSADSLAALLEDDIDAVIKLCKAALLSTNLAASLTASSEDTDPSTAPCYASHATYATPLLALFVDRLEILLSSPLFIQSQREAFVALLETLANSGAILVLSACRNDFYPNLVNYPSLMAGKSSGAHFDLAPPTRAELLQMIRLPASAAGLSWQQDNTSAMGLDELLCFEAANNPDSLPMLQYTLQELYLQRSETGELKLEVFHALGGIEGSIGKKAQEVTRQLSQADNASLAKVLSLLVTLSLDESNITSRAARWSQLEDKHQVALVKAMVESRLFVSHLQNGEPCFSVAHEALLRRWDKARLWIDDHLDSLSIKSRIHHLAKRWHDEAKGKAYLLAEGKPLQEAVALSSNPLFSLDNQERGFIQASIKRAQIKRWTRRVTIGLLCLLSFTSVLMSVKSLDAEQQALEKRLEAENLLGFMVGDFADKLRSVGRMDLLDGISNKALEYFSSDDTNPESKSNANSLLPHWLSSLIGFSSGFSNSKASFEARFQHAQTLEAMGEVAYSRGKLDEAIKAFETAKLLLDKLYTEDNANPSLLKVLGANAFWLGQISYAKEDWQQAEVFLNLYRDYSDALMILTPDDVDAWIELSYALNSLGSLALEQHDFQTARRNFERSLSLKTQALARKPTDNGLRSDRADTLAWLALANESMGKVTQALNLYQTSQLEFETLLANKKDAALIMSRLSNTYRIQAQLLRYQSQFSKALKKLALSAQLLNKALEQDLNNELWQSNLLQVEGLMIGIKTQISSDIITKPSHLLNTIDSEPLSEPLKLKFISSKMENIRYFQTINDFSNATLLISKIERLLVSITNIKSRYYLILQAELKLLTAYQFKLQDQPQDMLELCQEALASLKPIINDSTEIRLVLAFVQSNACLGAKTKMSREWQLLQSMGATGKGFIFIDEDLK